jgi:type VI secretion system protein ImpB
MTNSRSSQAFFRDNRPDRVHIEYEVTLDGATKKVELPFVAGVLADLSGKSKVENKRLDERGLLEFDSANFDKRMQAIAPRVAFRVPNRLTGEGELNIDLTFQSMDDFLPDRIAQLDPRLRELYARRQQLEQLLALIETKPRAEEALARLLDAVQNDPDSVLRDLPPAEPTGDAG